VLSSDFPATIAETASTELTCQVCLANFTVSICKVRRWGKAYSYLPRGMFLAGKAAAIGTRQRAPGKERRMVCYSDDSLVII
jgi:hypothetical protein